MQLFHVLRFSSSVSVVGLSLTLSLAWRFFIQSLLSDITCPPFNGIGGALSPCVFHENHDNRVTSWVMSCYFIIVPIADTPQKHVVVEHKLQTRCTLSINIAILANITGPFLNNWYGKCVTTLYNGRKRVCLHLYKNFFFFFYP